MTARSHARRRPPERGNALKTRARLFAAAKKAFAAKGLGGASLQSDILAEARVSPGSFYHQFDDKGDLLCEILRQEGARVIQALEKESSPEGNIANRIELRMRLLRALFEMADRHPEFVKIYIREYYSDDPRVRRAIRQHAERTIEKIRELYESVRNETGLPIDPELIATLLTTSNFAIINYYLDFNKSKRQAMRDRLIRGMAQLAAGGVLAVCSPEHAGGDAAE